MSYACTQIEPDTPHSKHLGAVIYVIRAGTLGERFTYGPGPGEPLVGQRQPKAWWYNGGVAAC